MKKSIVIVVTSVFVCKITGGQARWDYRGITGGQARCEV